MQKHLRDIGGTVDGFAPYCFNFSFDLQEHKNLYLKVKKKEG
jgi:hypothetical protein